MTGAYCPEPSKPISLFRVAAACACGLVATGLADAATNHVVGVAAANLASEIPHLSHATALYGLKTAQGIGSLVIGAVTGIATAYALRNKNHFNFG